MICDDEFIEVVYFCDARTCLNLSLVSKHHHQLVFENSLVWKMKYFDHLYWIVKDKIQVSESHNANFWIEKIKDHQRSLIIFCFLNHGLLGQDCSIGATKHLELYPDCNEQIQIVAKEILKAAGSNWRQYYWLNLLRRLVELRVRLSNSYYFGDFMYYEYKPTEQLLSLKMNKLKEEFERQQKQKTETNK